jgi:hypothetical protein
MSTSATAVPAAHHATAQTASTAALDALLESAAADGTVIVTFSNFKYLPILENWRVAMGRLGIDKLLVVALDQPTYDHLRGQGVPCHLSPCADDLSALWPRRVALFRHILRRGYNLIHSDVDAVWLKDPRAEHFLGSDADIVFSQATQWPTDCYAHWRFTLCCGLFFLRATDAVQDFMGQWVEHVADTRDDQVSFNQLLLAQSITWDIAEPYSVPTPFGVDITCSRRTIRGQAGALKVDVLPQHLFQRVHFPGEDAYVKHCLSGQTAETTREGLAQAGCWLLSDASPGR